ncbi:PilZ domain-containing protein [Novosphingobium sp. Gsoil 351]|uniref:PilZ domain-containing protein n=1 Tax=Novosphingobium sp. Gsoil 351 TaxID=2675225 RepID=UPI0012B4DCAB|nr:PilZ domain-containing protein [Novosphingobium sp. Gsoil 351]QGN53332.1 PilZ domain-containing protein [Novosphingobium sp. Gsoil 351]
MRHETFTSDSRPLRGAARRAPLSVLCDVRQGSRPWRLARLSDLSERGFKLAWMPDYDISKPLRIRISGIEMLSARICWHEGKQLGCAFATPLHVAVFDHIVRLAG